MTQRVQDIIAKARAGTKGWFGFGGGSIRSELDGMYRDYDEATRRVRDIEKQIEAAEDALDDLRQERDDADSTANEIMDRIEQFERELQES